MDEEYQNITYDHLEEEEFGDEGFGEQTYEISENRLEMNFDNANFLKNIDEDQGEVVKIQKRRCQRKKKFKFICLDETEEEVEGEPEQTEEVEEDEYSFDLSGDTSVLSAVTFHWDDKSYMFDELCDPGTIENIYQRYYVESDIIDDIGRKRYEYLCRILMIPPVMRFIRALETEEIDLSYRGLDGKTLRAMLVALETNTFVRKLILKYNKLTKDDCFYLGRTLNVNETIIILDLTGCRIGPDGIGYLVDYLTSNETLLELNLSKCNIKNEGILPLARVLLRNNSIEKLDLSYNNLSEDAADALALSLKINTAISDLNLCYNKFFNPLALKNFFRSMMSNRTVKNLNISWNALSGMDVGIFIGNFLTRNRSVDYLDLSNNRLEGPAVSELKKALNRSKVKILKLGRNPISAEDLEALLVSAKTCASLLVLDLEDLWVKKSFIRILKKIQLEKDLEVVIGGVYSNYEIQNIDFAEILFKRANYEANKPKSASKRKDFGHLIWTLGDEPLSEEDFKAKVKRFKAPVKPELIDQITKHFINPKFKLIDVVAMKMKYLSIFPKSRPPSVSKLKPERTVEENVDDEGETCVVTAVSAFVNQRVEDSVQSRESVTQIEMNNGSHPSGEQGEKAEEK